MGKLFTISMAVAFVCLTAALVMQVMEFIDLGNPLPF
jgi:hypothetical protein